MSEKNQELYYKAIGSLDMNKVVELHTNVFRPDQLRRTIFYSPRVTYYLSALVSHPNLQQEHQFLGAWIGDKLVAYAHYRVLKDSFHLNQIVVHYEHQGKGMGRYLIEEWKHRARMLRLPYVSLDVEKENVKAYNWYLRMRLNPVHETRIYECRVSPGAFHHEPAHFCLLDWENTEAWQKMYGFSTVRAQLEHQVWEVGWIWRALHIQKGLPEALLFGLLSILQDIKWVFMKSQQPLGPMVYRPLGNWKLASVIVRMRASLEEVI